MPDEKKKISVLLDMQIIRWIEDHKQTQTEAVTEALKYYYSEDRGKIESYREKILEQEKKILVLEARLSETEKFREIIREQNDISKAHVTQVQTLISHIEKIREDKILLLEDKRRWWRKLFI